MLALDWLRRSPLMLEYTRERLGSADNVELIEISGFELSPITNESVDLVYSTVVFMHLDEFERYSYVLEAYRILHPGGRVFVDNYSLCTDEGWAVFESHRTAAVNPRPSHIGHPSTPQELEAYLLRAGFREVQVSEDKTWVRAWGVKPSTAGEAG